jgi:DNA-binding NtrC family response regulator
VSNRVLVVDCDRAASVVTQQQLAAAGYILKVVDSFENALLHLTDDCPDLLITPVRLGQFNGLHLVLWCRARCPHLPILVTADQSDAGLALEAEQLGVRFLDSATDQQLFLSVVVELLAGAAAH